MRMRSVGLSLAAAALLVTAGMATAAPAFAVDVPLAPSTADQPVPLSVTDFTNTDVLLVGISLDAAPAGTTFRFADTSGLTPAYGYTLVGALRELSFTGTKAAVNNALATMLISTGAAEGPFIIHLGATLNQANVYYSASGNHLYQYVPGVIDWTSALTGATSLTLRGSTGYLTTMADAAENDFVASHVHASNIWIGASDQATEGVWRWMSGPEAGTQFWQQCGATGVVTPPAYFASWAAGEPATASGQEDYAATNRGASVGQWSALTNSPGGVIDGYLAEFGPPFVGVQMTDLSAAVGTGAAADSSTPASSGCGESEPSGQEPPPVIQQFGLPTDGNCAAGQPPGLNWAGVADGGWGVSWAHWMNDDIGGFVCTRTLVYSSSAHRWTVASSSPGG